MPSKRTKKDEPKEEPKEDLFENWPSLSSRVAEDVFALLDGYERRTISNRIPIQFRLEQPVIEQLDDLSKRLGKSRNELGTILLVAAIEDAMATYANYSGDAGYLEADSEHERADPRGARYTRRGKNARS